MFRFSERREELKRREKELMEHVQLGEKPKFKDLVSIMLAQYAIILPVAIGIMLAIGIGIKILLTLWGA